MTIALTRRAFGASAALSAFAGLTACNGTLQRSASGAYGPLIPDPNGLLDLPAGFTYRVISSLGDAMDDGGTVPDRADGMGAFAGENGTVILVRNHELPARAAGAAVGFPSQAAGMQAYATRPDGTALGGGTTTLEVDPRSGRIVRQHRSLAGTIRNCAGGQTPWRSWLTCEEDVTLPGASSNRDHGYIFEVPADARGTVAPVPLKAMGRFNHEAVVIDPVTGFAYLTEDRDDGLLYRFIPRTPGRLADGGQLQALALVDRESNSPRSYIVDTRNWMPESIGPAMPLGVPIAARWVDLDNPESPADDLRARGFAAGAAKFARGEGIHFGRNELYFACTSGGRAKLSQIFKLDMGRGRRRGHGGSAERLTLFFESETVDQMNFGDNLTIMPSGALMVCEDQYSDPVDNHLRMITPDGTAHPFARIRVQTEPAGVCFSPSGREMFVNLYSPTKTLMISGPW